MLLPLNLTDWFYDRGWDIAGDLLGNVSDWVGTFMEDHGVLAPFLLLFLEESGIPVPLPGDVMVMYAGYQVSLESIEYWQALIYFILVVAGGSSVLYWLARCFGMPLVTRFGRYVHCAPERLERVRPVMDRWGPLAIIFGRHIPGLRVPITLFAGILRFPYPIFVVSVMLSTAIWAGAFLFVGLKLGPEVHVLTHPHGRIWLVVVAVLAGLAAGAWWWRAYGAPRRKKRHLTRHAT
jgi:membrane protein DedA with SNARE-associated domain